MSHYALYISSKKAWGAMLAEIARARQSIYLEMYIMVDDASGSEFVELLARKAREGVLVKIVLDSFGSYSLSDEAVLTLRKSGAEVLFFSRWLHRLHRKLLIVDERVAISGGVNIHTRAESWVDLALRVTAHRAVSVALGLFAKTYFMAGGRDEAIRRFSQQKKTRRLSAMFVQYGTQEKHRGLKRFYMKMIAEARTSIRIVTPYFVPDRWLAAALDAAALRGVAVDILVPKVSDLWFMDRANHFSLLKMAKTGVRVFLYPRMNHAKVLVVDGREALVGSQNMDALSFNRNIESGVLISDPAVVDDIATVVQQWMSESEILNAKTYRRRWYDFVLAPVIRLFQPFL